MVVPVEVELNHFHGFQLLQARFFGDFVLSFVGVVFQMAHIGDVAYVANFVSQVGEVAVHDVEGYGRTCVAQMAVAVHGWAAHVHPDTFGMQRCEGFLLAAERVVYRQVVVSHDLGHEGVGYVVATLGVAGVFGHFAGDFAEVFFVLGDVVAEGEEEVFGVFGSHDYAALYFSLGHVGCHADEVEVEFVAAVRDYSEVAIVA